MISPQVGTFGPRYPYVRTGSGPPLVVLPGMVLDNAPPGRARAWSYALGFGRLASDRTVYVVPRPRGLPPDAGLPDIATGYAEELARLGEFDLMGLSTGGAVAQHLALHRPALVRRLALVVTGARLAPGGQAICRRWLLLAEQRRWPELRADMAASAVDGAVPKRLARAAQRLFGGRAAPAPADATDFHRTVECVLAHDLRDDLRRLTVRTLVVGGAEDPFFPESHLRETATAIPGSSLQVVAGSGHGLPKHHGAQLQATVAQFLG